MPAAYTGNSKPSHSGHGITVTLPSDSEIHWKVDGNKDR